MTHLFDLPGIRLMLAVRILSSSCNLLAKFPYLTFKFLRTGLAIWLIFMLGPHTADISMELALQVFSWSKRFLILFLRYTVSLSIFYVERR